MALDFDQQLALHRMSCSRCT